MTAQELINRLLENPDYEVEIWDADSNQLEFVTGLVSDSKNKTYTLCSDEV